MPVVTRLAIVVALSLAAAPAARAADASLIDAVKRGDVAAVERTLKQGADVNARQPDGATALHWAAHNNDLATVTRLLHAGADAKAANDLGVTPIHIACTNGSVPIANALI